MRHAILGKAHRGDVPIHAGRTLRVTGRATLVLLVVAIACGDYGLPDVLRGGPSGGSDDNPGGYQTEPRPAVTIARVTDLGPIHESPDVLARDGGLSGVFDGRSVWLFGDTFFRLHQTGEAGGMSNSFAWTRDLHAADGIDLDFPTTPTGAPRPFLPDTDAEHAFNVAHAGLNCTATPCGARFGIWPQALVADPERARMLVFYGKIYAELGVLNFSVVGQSMAVWQDFDLPPVRVTEDDTKMMFRDPDRAYGNAAVTEGDDLYVYGCGSDAEERKACRIARVPLRDALDLGAWRYFAADGAWSPSPEDAAPVLEAGDILSVAYNSHLSKYLAVYTPPVTDQVMMRTSPRPEGPWSDAVVAFTTRTPTSLWVYDAQAHPEMEGDGGRIQYVTYSLTTSDVKSEMRLVEVELGRSETVALAVLGPGKR